jgi:hypothetical protein
MRVVAVIVTLLIVVPIVASLPLPKILPWMGALLAVLGVYILICAVSLVERYKLRRLISGLPRGEGKITLGDQFRSSAWHMSFGWLLFLFGVFALNAAMSALTLKQGLYDMKTANILIFGAGALYWGAVLNTKLRLRGYASGAKLAHVGTAPGSAGKPQGRSKLCFHRALLAIHFHECVVGKSSARATSWSGS